MVAWQRLKDEPVDTLDLREVRLSVPKAGLNYASVRRRCSACRVDSCRNVYSVGQSTMNWRRGLFRLWIVGTALFVIAVAFVSYSEIKAEFDVVARASKPEVTSSFIAEFRQQYPEYNSLTDAQLLEAVYEKFYSDVPREQFEKRISEKISASDKAVRFQGQL